MKNSQSVHERNSLSYETLSGEVEAVVYIGGRRLGPAGGVNGGGHESVFRKLEGGGAYFGQGNRNIKH